MGKRNGAPGARPTAAQMVEERAAKVAAELSMELYEVTLQKESRGKCLCVYVDQKGGISLDDCERYHKALQPLLEDIDYDVMEVSSPGIDRPIKTMRDFERNKGALVEVKLFAPCFGAKTHQGALLAMDDRTVTIAGAQPLTFERKAVAIVKPVIDLDAEALASAEVGQEILSDMELE